MRPRRLLPLALMLSVALGGCTRMALAPLIPKLDVTWRVRVTRSAALGDQGSSGRSGDRVDTGVAAVLRWQPAVYGADVPERYEAAPAAWLAPCELDDVTCFAEFAESEREIAAALQEAP